MVSSCQKLLGYLLLWPVMVCRWGIYCVTVTVPAECAMKMLCIDGFHWWERLKPVLVGLANDDPCDWCEWIAEVVGNVEQVCSAITFLPDSEQMWKDWKQSNRQSRETVVVVTVPAFREAWVFEPPSKTGLTLFTVTSLKMELLLISLAWHPLLKPALEELDIDLKRPMHTGISCDSHETAKHLQLS